jgi:hypothetical protein
LGMSRRTIYTGIRELQEMDDGDPERPSGDAKRVRRRAGGRRAMIDAKPQLAVTLQEVLAAHSAASPTDERVRWTDLKPMQLAQVLRVVSTTTMIPWRPPSFIPFSALRVDFYSGVGTACASPRSHVGRQGKRKLPARISPVKSVA